jgi:hypothetical protein
MLVMEPVEEGTVKPGLISNWLMLRTMGKWKVARRLGILCALALLGTLLGHAVFVASVFVAHLIHQ